MSPRGGKREGAGRPSRGLPTTKVTVYNDTLIDSKIRFECNLLFENKTLETNEKEIFIEAGYFKRFKKCYSFFL